MKIWFIEVGEPLLFEKKERMHRYGMLMPYLVAAGHEVTWWCSSFSHFKKSQLRDQDTVETVDGVRLKILYTPGYARNISLGRFRHNFAFAAKFKKQAAGEPKPDLIVAPVPILESSYEAIRYGQKNNVPVVTDIRDEWPEEFVEAVPSFARWVARIVLAPHFYFMSQIAKKAKAIMAMSEKQLAYGLRYAGRSVESRDRVFHLGYQRVDFPKSEIDNAQKQWLARGIKSDHFIVCFFGVFGKAFDLKTVITAVKELSTQIPIQLVLAGHGERQSEYQELAKDCSAILFPGWVDALQIRALMPMASVGIAPYSASRFSMPNKPFEYLSAGLPIVSSIQGALKKYLEEYQCGVYYESSDTEGLKKILNDLYRDPVKTKTMRQQALKLFEEHFQSSKIYPEMVRYLENSCNF